MPIKSVNLQIRKSTNLGFTLIELLVVIAILGVLVTIGLSSFRSSQMRGRDAQRKSDLKQISAALELFFSDKSQYPAESGGKIVGCPSNTNVACVWGDKTKALTDSKTVYMKIVPADPAKTQSYLYRTIVINGVPTAFQLFAHLENTQDASLITTAYTCGNVPCNFAITSANTTPSE